MARFKTNRCIGAPEPFAWEGEDEDEAEEVERMVQERLMDHDLHQLAYDGPEEKFEYPLEDLLAFASVD